MPASSTAMIEAVAEALGDLREEVVFLGGATLPLLITDLGASLPRATVDVDMAVRASTQSEYARFEKQLRGRGFSPDPDGPIGRYIIGSFKADFTPSDPRILGYTNRWYSTALASATWVSLPSGRQIRLASAPALIATKFEAFKGRGHGDYRASRDLEDIVALVDGRAELVGEVRTSPDSIRDYLAKEFGSLLELPSIEEVISSLVLPDSTSQSRTTLIFSRFQAIADLGLSKSS
jgi:hypothetical protein